MTSTIKSDAALVPIASFVKKNSGTPMSTAAPKHTSCRFVRLNTTFVLIFDRSFGTGTYAIK